MGHVRTAPTALGAALAIALLPPAHTAPNPNLPLDRSYTLRNHSLPVVEGEYHRMAVGDRRRSFILPRPCLSSVDSSRVCDGPTGWLLRDSSDSRLLAVSPTGGYEFRYREGSEHSMDIGAIAQGYAGPASFLVDARIFTEIREGWAPSYDRETVDRQDETASGIMAYTSYSRYRHNLSIGFEWGRLTAARDAAHWGPGQFNNLVFHQDAVPFNQLSFTTRFGPLNIQSLYGQLVVEGDRIFDTIPESRSLYAHRYEWNLTRDLLIGISEQVVIYNNDEPFSVIPLVPLFMAKGEGHERRNNGSLAADVSWRLPCCGTLYTEFLIDDIQSPTSLFDNHWGNKWAWLAGAHWAESLSFGATGLVFEYVRIEPWVYTHYRAHTAQSANGGYPLGNPLGPNSQGIGLKAYVRDEASFAISARFDLRWKGTDLGSSLQDEHRDGENTKDFIAGVRRPEAEFRPEATWVKGRFLLSASAGIGARMSAVLRAQARM